MPAIVATDPVSTSEPISPEAIDLYNRGCTALGQADAVGAISYFRRAVLVAPGWFEARYNWAFTLQRNSDLRGAIAVLRRCVADLPHEIRAKSNLGNLLIEAGDYRAGLEIFADLAARFPDDQSYVENRAYASWRCRMADGARAAGAGFARILLACMPKSGSTFLADTLAKLPGMHRAHLVPLYGRREQELCIEQLIHHRQMSYVTQLHIKPSGMTLELAGLFELRPVFLFRNIWDVMVSFRDHMYNNHLDWSMAQIDPAFRSWNEARQYDFLARAMMPWFIDFYVGWQRVEDKLTIRYETMMAQPRETVLRIAEWAGLKAGDDAIDAALGRAGRATTFNKGISGRGEAVPASARDQVRALAAYYTDIDFEPLFGA